MVGKSGALYPAGPLFGTHAASSPLHRKKDSTVGGKGSTCVDPKLQRAARLSLSDPFQANLAVFQDVFAGLKTEGAQDYEREDPRHFSRSETLGRLKPKLPDAIWVFLTVAKMLVIQDSLLSEC